MSIPNDEIQRWVAEALRNIYAGFEAGLPVQMLEPNLFELETQNMIDAVETGIGFEYGKPNLEMALKLAESGLWFAARKTYAEANTLAQLLADGTRKRTWSEFKKLATPIVKQYNQTWLRTEYNTAVRSARMASTWGDIERTADLYPNVEYVRTRSATPREEHLKYVGIIRPITDIFWDTHTPPLSWNCLCSIRASNKPVTAIPPDLPKPSPGLQNNPAKSGKLFSDSLPYANKTKDVEAELQKATKQAVAKMGVYYKVKTPKGEIVLVHPAHQNSDVPQNLPTAVLLAENGYKAELPPHELNQKKPDLKINSTLADIKEPGSREGYLPKSLHDSIENGFASANKQNLTFVVYRFDRSLVKYTDSVIMWGLFKGVKSFKKIENIILIDLNGVVLEITRKQILDKDKSIEIAVSEMKWHKE